MRTTLTLDEAYDKLTVMGNQLVRYSYPKSPKFLENSIYPWRSLEVVVDGYLVIVNYNRSEMSEKKCYLETIQIFGKRNIFLPFSLVIKIAQKFLGNQDLSLLEIYKSDRKVYLWSCLVDYNGKPIKSELKVDSEIHYYNDFKYNYLDSSKVNFY